MPIVIKRIKKYFPGRESYFAPNLFDEAEGQETGLQQPNGAEDSELLRTIKLQKNIFRLSLPSSTYAVQSKNF